MKRDGAFTLIELLVVVAVIALLIAILIPSLGSARANARATKCGASLRAVGQALRGYTTENQDYFPPSYLYVDNTGNVIPAGGSLSNVMYQHWSSALFGNLKDLRAFTCPEFERGGVPRTNPGPRADLWMPNQIDNYGSVGAGGASAEDRQAPWMAFTANAAIMPRNKFNAAGTHNMWVRSVAVQHESSTIIATEFNANWVTISENSGAGLLCKGHRSINPFYNLGSGTDEYGAAPGTFFVPSSITSLVDGKTSATTATTLINDPNTQLNAVGRHHPGSISKNGRNYGGTTNFVYLDGHVERKNIVETMTPTAGAWEWGERYYTLSVSEVKF